MDFMTMMERRYSCRSFQDKAVAREDLLKIVEAGRLTPSACNSQPWKFLVIDEEEAKEKLCDALVLDGGITGCPWREKVPAFLVLCECEAKIIKRAAEYYALDARASEWLAGLDPAELPEGGTVSLTLRDEGSTALEVSVRRDGDGFEILRWQTVYAGDWEPEESIQLFDFS